MLLSNEFKYCDCGDKRLTGRIMRLANFISENPELTIKAASGSFAASKGAYRFFQNEKVDPKLILAEHVKNSSERVKSCQSRVLVIQDTTDLIYTRFPSIKGLGKRLSGHDEGKAKANGMLLHSSFAVSSDGVPLGLLKQTYFTFDEVRENRGQADRNVRGLNKKIPIEQKASYRWIDHLVEVSKELESCSSQIVHVADRECDIFEFLQSASDHGSQYVVRSSSNRRTHEGPAFHDASTLEEALAKETANANVALAINGKTVLCREKTLNTVLKPPQRSQQAKSMNLEPLKIGVVDIKQIECQDDPIHWRLLTNLPIASTAQATEIIEIYKQRWSIECFHRILKSGFGVEKARLSNRLRLEKLASLLSVVSWHIFWLYQLGRKMPEMEAAKIFDPLAIKVLQISAKKLKINTQSKLLVGKAVEIIAKLGGFLGRKSDGEPGMTSIWRGWRNLYERIEFRMALTYG